MCLPQDPKLCGSTDSGIFILCCIYHCSWTQVTCLSVVRIILSVIKKWVPLFPIFHWQIICKLIKPKTYKIQAHLKVTVTQLCPTLCDPMDYTVHGILQAWILERVAFPFFKWSSQPRNWTGVSCIPGRFFTNWAIRKGHRLNSTDIKLVCCKVKFRLKLKKVRKTTRPFRYDLNQFPYDYTVEVRNIFKGLDWIESLINYGQRFVTLFAQETGIRPFPRKKNAKKQNGCLRRP